MTLIERRFEDLSRLQYRIFTCDLDGKHGATALVFKFAGVYGVGSAGNNDALFMCAITKAAFFSWHANAIVFDLSELDYQWGDGLLRLFGIGIPSIGIERLPMALVVSDLCKDAITSWKSLVPPMFDNLESAMKSVEKPARDRLEQVFAQLDTDFLPGDIQNP